MPDPFTPDRHINELAIGAAGTITGVCLLQAKKFQDVLAGTIAGMACSYILPDVVHYYWEYPPQFRNAVIYLMGLLGLIIVKTAYKRIGDAIKGSKLTGIERKNIMKGE